MAEGNTVENHSVVPPLWRIPNNSFKKRICSYLEPSDVANLFAITELGDHFRLNTRFCVDHLLDDNGQLRHLSKPTLPELELELDQDGWPADRDENLTLRSLLAKAKNPKCPQCRWDARRQCCGGCRERIVLLYQAFDCSHCWEPSFLCQDCHLKVNCCHFHCPHDDRVCWKCRPLWVHGPFVECKDHGGHRCHRDCLPVVCQACGRYGSCSSVVNHELPLHFDHCEGCNKVICDDCREEVDSSQLYVPYQCCQDCYPTLSERVERWQREEEQKHTAREAQRKREEEQARESQRKAERMLAEERRKRKAALQREQKRRVPTAMPREEHQQAYAALRIRAGKSAFLRRLIREERQQREQRQQREAGQTYAEERRKAALQRERPDPKMARQSEVPAPQEWQCECCQKSYQSQGQWDNHIKSRKHKQAMKHHG